MTRGAAGRPLVGPREQGKTPVRIIPYSRHLSVRPAAGADLVAQDH